MVYSTYTDVRDIIDTGLSDARLTALIILADAEISERDIDATTNVLKQISMLITASLAAMNDVRSFGKADYAAENYSGTALSKMYRNAAEALIESIGSGGSGGKPRARLG